MRAPTRSVRRSVRVAVVATVAAAALLLTGCVPYGLLPKQHQLTSSPAPADVSKGLQPFYSQHLAWTHCATGMVCADAKAPLDWNDPGKGSIRIAMIMQPAKGKAEGSLLVNPGGPGGSGFDFVRDSVDYAVDKKLQQHYNIVGFDPRGVGRSTAVKCYGPTAMTNYLYSITPGVRGSTPWIQSSTQQAKDFASACKANSGSLLAYVGTTQAARDLDLMRGLLGQQKLDYLGYSYGTYLGTVYASLYPKHVGRLVLDGALDPTSSNFEVTKVQAEGFETDLRQYLATCLKQSSCPFHGSVQDGMNTIASLLAQVDAHPIRDSDGRELGANTLLTAIIYPLYDTTAWSYLNSMFAQVMKGKATDAFTLADGYNGRNDDGSYQDNSTEAFTAINCLDYSYDADPAHMQAQQAELSKAAPVLGPYMGYGDIQCAAWPYQSTTSRAPIHAAGAAPIMVVGTTGDPATPYQWAVHLSKQLDSGHLVTYHGFGHTAYNKSNSCVNGAVDDYLVNGTVPKRDPEC